MTLQHLLGKIVGAANVLTAPEDTKPYLTDWRRLYSAAAECVVRPASAQEVARVVALCAREGVAVVPQGGNTGQWEKGAPASRSRVESPFTSPADTACPRCASRRLGSKT